VSQDKEINVSENPLKANNSNVITTYFLGEKINFKILFRRTSLFTG
jgi:hypothetical protein